MININGVIYTSIESLEYFLSSTNYSDNEKTCIVNDFNNISNQVVNSIQPVTNQQLRSALVMMSIQLNKPSLHPEAIRVFIETLSEPNRSLALQQWEYSNEMMRSNQLVNSMASALGLTSTDLDNLWNYARTL